MSQISLFEILDNNDLGEKYDAYVVTESKSFIACDSRKKIEVGEIYTLYCRLESADEVMISKNYIFAIPKKIFDQCFKYIGHKILPKSKELWNGKKWIVNPSI